MGKAHQNEKKRVQPKSEINAQTTGKIIIINRKQTVPTQSSTQTHLGICYSAMGNSLKVQHRNPSRLPIQDSRIYSK
jgi:hypothetical protein